MMYNGRTSPTEPHAAHTFERVDLEGYGPRLYEEATKIRGLLRMLQAVALPLPDSLHAELDAECVAPPVSLWAMERARAAVEHLMTWADTAAPVKRVNAPLRVPLGYRWHHTLVRCALESAAQSIWLMSASHRDETLIRHDRMAIGDLGEQIRAYASVRRPTHGLEERRGQHKSHLRELHGGAEPPAKPPGYVDMIRGAARSVRGVGAAKSEFVWRSASGAAHGMLWVRRELQTELDDVHQLQSDGNRYPVLVVDLDLMLEAVGIARAFTHRALELLAQRNGFPAGRQHNLAMAKAVAELTEWQKFTAG